MHGSQVKFRTISSREKLVYKKLIISIKKQDNLSAKHVHVFGKSRTCFPKRSYVFSVILPPKTKAHVKIYKKPYFNEMLNEKAVPKQSFTRASHQNIPQSMQIVILTLCNLNAWRIDYFEARYGLLPNSKIFFTIIY